MRNDIHHDCIIGLLYLSHHGVLATLPYLEEAIKKTKEFNEDCKKYNMWSIIHKEYTLKDYADRRKSTNLTRFNFCPECGKEIGWKAIGRDDDGK